MSGLKLKPRRKGLAVNSDQWWWILGPSAAHLLLY